MKTRWVVAATATGLVGLGLLFTLSAPLRSFHSMERWLSQDPERRQLLAAPLDDLIPRPGGDGFTVEVYGIAFEVQTPPSSVEERWEGFTVLRADSVSIVCEDAGSQSYVTFLSSYGLDPTASLTLPAIADSLRNLFATSELTRAEFLDLGLGEQEAYVRHVRIKGSSRRALRGVAIVEGAHHVALLLRGYHRRTPQARLGGESPRSGVAVLVTGDRRIDIVVIGETYQATEQVAEHIAATVRPTRDP